MVAHNSISNVWVNIKWLIPIISILQEFNLNIIFHIVHWYILFCKRCFFSICSMNCFKNNSHFIRAPGWLSRLNVPLQLRSGLTVREFEPRIGLCAYSSEPGPPFRFCVSLSLWHSPAHTLSLSKINKHLKNKKNNNSRFIYYFIAIVLNMD